MHLTPNKIPTKIPLPRAFFLAPPTFSRKIVVVRLFNSRRWNRGWKEGQSSGSEWNLAVFLANARICWLQAAVSHHRRRRNTRRDARRPFPAAGFRLNGSRVPRTFHASGFSSAYRGTPLAAANPGKRVDNGKQPFGGGLSENESDSHAIPVYGASCCEGDEQEREIWLINDELWIGVMAILVSSSAKLRKDFLSSILVWILREIYWVFENSLVSEPYYYIFLDFFLTLELLHFFNFIMC